MVRDDVGEVIKPEQRNLAQHLALAGNAGSQDVVKSRNTVGGNEQQLLVANVVHVAHFAAGVKAEIGKVSS